MYILVSTERISSSNLSFLRLLYSSETRTDPLLAFGLFPTQQMFLSCVPPPIQQVRQSKGLYSCRMLRWKWTRNHKNVNLGNFWFLLEATAKRFSFLRVLLLPCNQIISSIVFPTSTKVSGRKGWNLESFRWITRIDSRMRRIDTEIYTD